MSPNSGVLVAAQNSNKNLVASPFSAHVALAMTYFGAAGNTAIQMNQGLAIPADDSLLKESYKNLIERLNDTKNVELSVANKIYISEVFFVKPEFMEITKNFFMSAAEEVNFSIPNVASTKINEWTALQTHDKIKEIVKDNDLNSLTRAVLLNAVYFKGNWATQFKPKDTKNLPFNLNARSRKNVPTMYRKGAIKFGILPKFNASFVELPYKGNDLSMMIIRPDEIEGLAEVESKLNDVTLSTLLTNGYPQDVELYLPKFKIESTLNLVDPLKQLGMTDMFDDSLADFLNMTDGKGLYVSKVIQKAFILVNEEGSEAAAVTAVVMKERSMPSRKTRPVIFKVDRPFIFMINYYNTPIFIGHVTDL
ncbi:antichymotrypsin-2-like isoform X2 [Prorops nasuta]|uniref:antichymotrypsin-2-like isoform X2 n=1 Tax=Prorops nasuta TaxID=863751 RepID=UPI0034CF1953